jgi:hypothetical protein
MKKFYIILCICCATQIAHAQWPTTNANMRPWTRWWWMGNAVDSAGINNQLESFKEAGIGGVEIVPIYGAVGAENKYLNYLSPDWMKMLDATVSAASKRNMGVYMSVGSGWPIGGPQITEDDAATKLIIQQYDLKEGQSLTEKIVVNDEKLKTKNAQMPQAVMAYGNDGSYINLTSKVKLDGTLDWVPTKGSYHLYVAFIGKTKQKVKRAAPGGEGYTLDHFNGNAVNDYLQKFYESLSHQSHGVWAFYNDSYEVFNADWSPNFFSEFEKRRGYDLRNHLNLLVSKDQSDSVAKIKSDYRETMSDMMIENFSYNFNKWSHDKNALSLNQAHGSPANLLDMYAAVDIPETESFGATHFDIKGLHHDSGDYRNVDPEPLMMKFASSAAHAQGNNLTSSETFTWLSEHFKTTWAQCKPEVENLFLAGINHVFFHGTTYSSSDVAWPGWLFYASVEFVPNNSLWPHLNAMNSYITRCQSILQSGKPDNEVLMYWPVYDAWENPRGMDLPFRVHDVNEWLQPTEFYKDVKALESKGFSVDFASDKMLSDALCENGSIGITKNGARNKILVIPTCKRMPAETMAALMKLAQSGATIVFQSLPESTPGLLKKEESKLDSYKNQIKNGAEEPNSIYAVGKGKIILNNDIADALNVSAIYPESLTQIGLQFIRRQMDDGKYYFIVNHTSVDIDTIIALQAKESSVQFMNPQSGFIGNVKTLNKQGENISIQLQLKSGESLIIKTSLKGNTVNPKWPYLENANQNTVLNGKWQLHFKDGGPTIPKDTIIDRMQYWTGFSSESYQSFSGVGVYSQSFNFKKGQNKEYILVLDSLHESAHIWINDKDAGYIWANPAELKIGTFLKSGKNTIRIEVANLMANRIRYMDQHKIEWRKYHEINFVNINYKNFDAADWQVSPSGMSAPVLIKEYKIIE